MGFSCHPRVGGDLLSNKKKEMPSPYADHAHISASCIQGECRDRLLADCHD